ncbi:sulfurtransferase TusA family protein [Nitrospirota bacterium]
MGDRVKVIDARGEVAPLPLLELRRALDKAAPGQGVELVSDDPAMSADVEMFIKASGHELVYTQEEDASVRFTVRKV